MGFWEIFWAASIIFAVISFTILSGSILMKGFQEVKDMLTTLDERDNNQN